MRRNRKSTRKAVELKFKSNRKQFKLHSQIENILGQIQAANQQAGNNQQINSLVDEAKVLIHKRQKLMKIADRNKDGWQVVEEYESNDLASDTQNMRRNSRKPRRQLVRREKLKIVNDTKKRSAKLLLILNINFFVVRLQDYRLLFDTLCILMLLC